MGALIGSLKGGKMTVSWILSIFIVVKVLTNNLSDISMVELLALLILLISNGIISICSRLDDLKRK